MDAVAAAVRNLNDSEQRIGAPVLLSHAELADLSGHNRVTVTKQLSKWRCLGLIEQDEGPDKALRISPGLLGA